MTTAPIRGKINSRKELAELKEKFRGAVLMRLVSDVPENRIEVNVGMGECGIKAGARDILKLMFNEVTDAKLENTSVIAVDCMGKCDVEPTVEIVFPGQAPVRYQCVNEAIAKEIIKSHVIDGKIVEQAKMEV